MRGFLTLEILVALMIATSTLIAVSLLALGTPEVLARSREHRQALALTEATLEKAEALSREDFSEVTSLASSTDDIYETRLTVSTLPSDVEKKLTVQTIWHDGYGTLHSVTLTTIVTDFTHPRDAFCTSALVGNWNDPSLETQSFSDFKIQGLISTGTGIVAISSTTALATDPVAIQFTKDEDGTLTRAGSMDTNTGSTAGLTTITRHGNTLYMGSASRCTGTGCGQLQVATFDTSSITLVGHLLLSTSTKPFAKKSDGKPVPAVTITYSNGRTYLGLDVTDDGDEFVIIDVENPALPRFLGSYSVGATVTSITLRGSFVYITTNDATRDLMVLDVHTPSSIQLVSSYDAPLTKGIGGLANAVGFSGTTLWLLRDYAQYGDELSLIDMTDPSAPSLLTSRNITTGLASVSAYTVVLRDTLAVLLTKKDIQLWDSSDNLSPSFKKAFALPNGSSATGLTCENHTLYISSVGENSTSYITTLTGS